MTFNCFKMASCAAVLALGMAALPANAYMIGGGATDVGGLDTFKGATTQGDIGNANPAGEEAWAESVLGFDVTYTDKTEDVSIQVVDGETSIVAFSLVGTPGYYIVKDSTEFVLFQNIASLDWGVLDLATYFGLNKLDDLEFSHVTEFNGDVPVPEPGSLALLALGLMGLGMARRRIRSA